MIIMKSVKQFFLSVLSRLCVRYESPFDFHMFPKLHAEKEAKLHEENGSSLMGGMIKRMRGSVTWISVV